MNNDQFPFADPIYVMLKPVGAKCNLACDYCYYLEKSGLYPHFEGNGTMSEDLLEKFTFEYINAQTTPDVLFSWHGGEPLMRPVEFYRKALRLQKLHSGGRRIDNCIQTNGTLLNDEWCQFFKENNFLVGISLDGPAHMHNTYRKDRAMGGSFDRVMNGVKLLKKHGVEFNCMAVVNAYNVQYPEEFYDFFKCIGCNYIQFTPIVERLTTSGLAVGENTDAKIAPFSVTPKGWGEFLCRLFDRWVKHDVGRVFIQLFDTTLANWVGAPSGVCTMAPRCGHAAAMEYNGDVYVCDHFVFPQYKLGNIYQQSLMQMLYSNTAIKFGKHKQEMLTTQCRECQYLFACNGECPKNRFVQSENQENGHNYLCDGYHRFFDHVAPYMDFMKHELQAQRSPANVMQWRYKAE